VGSLFERARDALRRHDAAAADELEAAWNKRPYIVAISGDCAEVVSAAIGLKVGVRDARVRRGSRSRFRAVKEDGTSEEHALDAVPAERERLLDSVREAKQELDQRATAIEKAGSSVPIVVRRQPKWWQLWLWPLWFVLSWIYRRRLVAVERAVGAGDDARRGVEAAELELATSDTRAREVRARYAESLRAVAATAKSLEIEVADGPLAVGVELVTDPDGADLVLPAREVGVALGRLDQIAAKARELALVRRAREVITAAGAALDKRLARAEEEFRTRLARFDAMRIGDVEGFVSVVTARVRPQIVAGVHALMEHAAVHLGSELTTLSTEWIGSIAGAADGDALSAVVERVEVSAPNVTQRIADEVRLLVANGVAGVVHDLWPELVAALEPHGLPPPAKAVKAEVPPVELLPSLGGSGAKLGGRLKRLTGLFKGFDSKRTDARESAHARLEHLKEVANAELLDAEPRLHEAIAAAIAGELGQLIALQQTWLERAMTKEREAVVKDREGLAAVAAARDAAFRDADALADELARVAA